MPPVNNVENMFLVVLKTFYRRLKNVLCWLRERLKKRKECPIKLGIEKCNFALFQNKISNDAKKKFFLFNIKKYEGNSPGGN